MWVHINDNILRTRKENIGATSNIDIMLQNNCRETVSLMIGSS